MKINNNKNILDFLFRLLIIFLLFFFVGVLWGYFNFTSLNSLIFNEKSDIMEKEDGNVEVERIYVYEEYEYDTDESVMSILNSLVEENKTMYYIRNELLYRNDYLDRDRANIKSATIYENCVSNGINPWLVIAIGIVESNLQHIDSNKEIVESHANARGMFQITPIIERIYDINAVVFEDNVRGATLFIRDLWDNYSNYKSEKYSQIELVLAHYNGGSRPVYALENYTETMEYVPKVLRIYERLVDRYE